jgi:hypothetical protein
VNNNRRGIRGTARARALGWLLALAAAIFASAARADLVVPAGSLMTLGPGTVDLACTDVVVSGALQVNSGQLRNVRSFTIASGGSVDGGSGLIEVGGNWTNAGGFNAAVGTVNFRDLCAFGNATILGNTTFNVASFVTSSGKNYVFGVTSTQTILQQLEIAGTAPQPIQFRSSNPGQTAFINLVNGGVQLIQHVGVTDVWATGQWLAPNLTNEGGGGNANRWFGTPNPTITQIPTLGTWATVALILLMALLGAHFKQRSALQRASNKSKDMRRGTRQGEA